MSLWVVFKSKPKFLILYNCLYFALSCLESACNAYPCTSYEHKNLKSSHSLKQNTHPLLLCTHTSISCNVYCLVPLTVFKTLSTSLNCQKFLSQKRICYLPDKLVDTLSCSDLSIKVSISFDLWWATHASVPVVLEVRNKHIKR